MHLKNLLRRLKNPSVLLSLISYIVTILLLIFTDINISKITTISATALSIFTVLGIMSNPDTKTKGYGDDILICPKCGKTVHVEVNGQMVCKGCGCKHSD